MRRCADLPPISVPRSRWRTFIVAPAHSLLQQSQNAEEAKLAVNGDGFGVAWYGRHREPGLYRDVLPAWADRNLISLCRNVSAPAFLAHVRASTTGETTRSNCHPFTHRHWSFMHNGQIAEFARLRRELETALPDDLYQARQGTTDSELLFLLILAHDPSAPRQACESVIAKILRAQGETQKPTRLTCVLSDGDAAYAFRYSSDARSPSLYLSKSLDNGGQAIASEPLDGNPDNWTEIPEGSFATVTRNHVAIEALFTRRAA